MRLAKAERPAFLSQLEAWCQWANCKEPEVTRKQLMNDLIFLSDSGGEDCWGLTETGMETRSSEE